VYIFNKTSRKRFSTSFGGSEGSIVWTIIHVHVDYSCQLDFKMKMYGWQVRISTYSIDYRFKSIHQFLS